MPGSLQGQRAVTLSGQVDISHTLDLGLDVANGVRTFNRQCDGRQWYLLMPQRLFARAHKSIFIPGPVCTGAQKT